MSIVFANNVSTTLAEAIDSVETVIALADPTGFPEPTGLQYYLATLVSPTGRIEIVKVTARTDNLLTVVRAQEGTSGGSFQVGTLVELRVTAGGLVDGSAVQTLTNKTIALADNTVSGTAAQFNAAVTDALLPFGFETRAALVSFWENGKLPDGTIISDGTVQYITSSGATGISDLSGLLPFGDLTPNHFGENTTPGTTDMTAVFTAVCTYANANRQPIKLLAQRYLVDGGTISLTYPGIGLYGQGEGNNSNLANSGTFDGSAPTELVIAGATGAGVTLTDQAQYVRNLRITADSTRAAASFDIDAPGVRIEPPDTSNAMRADRCAVQDVRIDQQPGDGVLMVGPVTESYVDRFAVYRCGGYGVRADAGILNDATKGVLTRTYPHYPGLLDIQHGKVGFCGGGTLALSCEAADAQAEMAIRCTVFDIDSFGNGINRAIMYDAPDTVHYDFWIFGENCEVNKSAPCGRSGFSLAEEELGGIYIAGRQNRLINNRFIDCLQPIYWGHVSAQPSQGLYVQGVRTVNLTRVNTFLILQESDASTGLTAIVDEVDTAYAHYRDVADLRSTSAGLNDSYVRVGNRVYGQRSVGSSADILRIEDDQAYKVELEGASVSVVVSGIIDIASTTYSSGTGRFHFRVGSGAPAITRIDGHTDTEAHGSAVALTGTTGTDGKFTVSCDATSIYLENRTGFIVTTNIHLSAIPAWSWVKSVTIST